VTPERRAAMATAGIHMLRFEGNTTGFMQPLDYGGFFRSWKHSIRSCVTEDDIELQVSGKIGIANASVWQVYDWFID
jgi:hypothetical protein